ncbi:hypothetical protein PHYPSEUDO_003443 [Phytophthora pseudosyringae]|uniref:Uncharacterized protein n=1 Tax=Phytophthora pseudosyringae TaxID=221518 RepID=A0A8T1WIP9_9STRA|nr:hypothetical protein PHYPSEUDO_003443 [Phytophthora pseudosyringae]
MLPASCALLQLLHIKYCRWRLQAQNKRRPPRLRPSSTGASNTLPSAGGGGWMKQPQAWGLTSTSQSSNTGGAIKRLLDAVPHARITKAHLIEAAHQGDDAGETEWALTSGVDLSGRPTYLMRALSWTTCASTAELYS